MAIRSPGWGYILTFCIQKSLEARSISTSLPYSFGLVPWKSYSFLALYLSLPLLGPGMTGMPLRVWRKIRPLFSFYFSSLIWLITDSPDVLSHQFLSFPKVPPRGISKWQNPSSEPWRYHCWRFQPNLALLTDRPRLSPVILNSEQLLHPTHTGMTDNTTHRKRRNKFHHHHNRKVSKVFQNPWTLRKKRSGMEFIPFQLSFFSSFSHVFFASSLLSQTTSDHVSHRPIRR